MGSRPGVTRHRAFLRKQVRANTLKSALASVVGVVACVRALDSPFGHFVDRFLMGETTRVRHCGDLLPIPMVIIEAVISLIPDSKDFAVGLTTLANFSLAGRNFLYGGMRAIAVPSKPTGAQRHAPGEILSKWWSLIRHAAATTSSIVSCHLLSLPSLWRRKEQVLLSTPTVSMVFLIVDRLIPLSGYHQRHNDCSVRRPFFPGGLVDVPVTIAFKGGSRFEYAKLVCSQITQGGSHAEAIQFGCNFRGG